MRFSPESRRLNSTVHQLEELLCNIKHSNSLNQLTSQQHGQAFCSWMHSWDQNIERFNRSLDQLDEHLQIAIKQQPAVPKLALYKQRVC